MIDVLDIKTNKTVKKFYNKWLYKVTIVADGISVWKNSKNDQEFFSLLSSGRPQDTTSYYLSKHWHPKQRAWDNRELLSEIVFLLSMYKYGKDYQTRVENSWLDVYTNDVDLYNLLSQEFGVHIVHRYQPDDSEINLLTENNYIVNKLPHGIYQYRAYLTLSKLNTDYESRFKICEFMNNLKPRITFTNSLEKWIMSHIRFEWDWHRRYCLVQDKDTLLMLKLRLGEGIGKVYKYVLSDK